MRRISRGILRRSSFTVRPLFPSPLLSPPGTAFSSSFCTDCPPPTLAVQGTRALLLNRMSHRQGHFMKSTMLDSQLATLQEPHETNEVNVAVVKLGQGEEEVEERGKAAVIEDAVQRARRFIG